MAHGMGYIPDLPDQRDHYFAAAPAVVGALPTAVDLRPQMPSVYDQGQLGSCTGNAIAAAVQFCRRKHALAPDFAPSRLFIYYQERVIEHTTRQDAGAMIRDGFKAIAADGAPDEVLWPYDVAKFARKPTKAAYNAGKLDLAIEYQRLVQQADQMRACLAGGDPFVAGISVYASFESAAVARTGDVPMPQQHEQMLGGHAILIVGFDDARRVFRFRNSWGLWGDQGYGTLPYDYLTNTDLASDLWVLRGTKG